MNSTLKTILLKALFPAEAASLAKSEGLDAEVVSKIERLKKLHPRSLGEDAFWAMCGVADEDELRRRYALPRELPSPLPLWALQLEALLEQWVFVEPEAYAHLQAYTKEEARAYGLEQRPCPLFAQFFHPAIAFARDTLLLDAAVQKALSPEALDCADRYLLYTLSRLAARSITYELKRASLQGETPQKRYESFFREMTPQRLYDFFERYPVLARCVAHLVHTHMDNVRTLARDLVEDLPEIRTTFTCKASLPCLQVVFGLSDPHRGGKTVAFVYLDADKPLVYKPHALHVDVWYESFIEWFNTLEGVLPMHAVKTLNKQTHGWSAYISHTFCESEAEKERFYTRHGQLLAIASLFHASDIHHENVIAQGEYPVLIDLECFFQPMIFDASVPLCLEYPYDLHATALLPSWIQGSENRPLFDDSGIFGSGHETYAIKKPFWKNLYTDTMELVYAHPRIRPEANVPSENYTFFDAAPYAKSVIEGYEATMRRLLEHREVLRSFARSSFITQAPVRILLRATQAYHDILLWSTAPDILRLGASYELSLRLLFIKHDSPADTPLLYENEIAELWHRDIPSYYFYPNTQTLLCASREVEGILPCVSLESLSEKLAQISNDALHVKGAFLKALFGLHFYRGVPVLEREDTTQSVAYALHVGELMSAIAVECHKSVTWIDFRTLSHASAKIANHYVGPWLYSGVLGMGLYVANLYRVIPDARYKTLALGALEQSLETVAYLKQHDMALPLSSYGGIYGVVYTLLEYGRLFSDETFTQQGLALIHTIPMALEGEIEIDFVNGIAGILPVLKKAYLLNPDSAYRVLMSRIYEKIASSITFEQGIAYHKAHEPMPLGLAHGMIGIAYALSCVCECLPKALGVEAWIEQAIAYEERFYDKEQNDWPDIRRKETQPFFMLGWCAGAPGQGLARIGIAQNLPVFAKKERVAQLAQTTQRRFHESSSAHLCCGQASQLWFLKEAGRYLHVSSLEQEAKTMAHTLLTEYQKSKVWHLQGVHDNEKVPSLFGGASGIALSFLHVDSEYHISDVVLLR